MKKWFWIGAFLVLSGCVETSMSDQFFAERNVIHWSQLEIGMTESQVQDIMKDTDKKESSRIGQNTYDAWFYLTDSTIQMIEKKYKEKNYTPLVFRNGILVGWGYPYYYKIFDSTRVKRKKAEENVLKDLKKAGKIAPEQRKLAMPHSAEKKASESLEKPGLDKAIELLKDPVLQRNDAIDETEPTEAEIQEMQKMIEEMDEDAPKTAAPEGKIGQESKAIDKLEDKAAPAQSDMEAMKKVIEEMADESKKGSSREGKCNRADPKAAEKNYNLLE